LKYDKEYRAGEGHLSVKLNNDGILLKYSSIDDFEKKQFSVDDLMQLLGYKSLNQK
jgi:hypothetical protein